MDVNMKEASSRENKHVMERLLYSTVVLDWQRVAHTSVVLNVVNENQKTVWTNSNIHFTP